MATGYVRAEQNELPTNFHHANIQWSVIIFGALVCLFIQVSLGLLGAGIGLSAFSLERGELPGRVAQGLALIFSAATLIISMFVGGYLGSRLAKPVSRGVSALYGVGITALVSLALVAVLSGPALLSIGGLVSTAGVGGGSAATIDAVFAKLHDLNPKLVTDMKILKGKAVTEIVMNNSDTPVAKDIENKTKKTAQSPGIKQGLRTVGRDVRRASSYAALAGFAGIFFALVFSIWGALVGDRHRSFKGKSRTQTRSSETGSRRAA
jgi:hypothetical protein